MLRACGLTMQPLRFALVTTDYPPYCEGDRGLNVQWLARALCLRGHAVEVIHDTDSYRNRTGRLPVAPERDHGIRVHRLRGGRLDSLGALRARLQRASPPYSARLKEILTGRFDVIHFHDIADIGGTALWHIGTGIKLQSVENYWLVCPKRDLKTPEGETCEKPTCTMCMLRHRAIPSPRPLDTFIDGHSEDVDAFIVQSRMALLRHRAAGFSNEMSVIPPFLPTAAPVLKTAERPAQRRPYFLYDGALSSTAALQDLLAEFTEDIDADFLILGRGPDTPFLRRLARRQTNIRFMGAKPPVARQSLIREASALVLPPDDGGRVPMAALSATREGTPVIAPDLGAGAEFVRDTGGGYHYKTLPELRAIYYRLAHDPAHAQELGRRAFSGHARVWREGVALNTYFDVIRDAAVRRGLNGLLAKLEPEEARHA